MLFESFLQNYIKNFEEQETNSALMAKLKKARLFSFWKTLAHLEKSSKNQQVEGKHPIEHPDTKNSKMAESSTFHMNEEVESEYMELVLQFRKVSLA